MSEDTKRELTQRLDYCKELLLTANTQHKKGEFGKMGETLAKVAASLVLCGHDCKILSETEKKRANSIDKKFDI